MTRLRRFSRLTTVFVPMHARQRYRHSGQTQPKFDALRLNHIRSALRTSAPHFVYPPYSCAASGSIMCALQRDKISAILFGLGGQRAELVSRLAEIGYQLRQNAAACCALRLVHQQDDHVLALPSLPRAYSPASPRSLSKRCTARRPSSCSSQTTRSPRPAPASSYARLYMPCCRRESGTNRSRRSRIDLFAHCLVQNAARSRSTNSASF